MSQINESAIKTPGVYINEIPSFPPSVAQVETAIPAFIGYTQIAKKLAPDDLRDVPKRIGSLVEFELYYGTGPSPKVTEVNIDDSNNFISAIVSNKYFMYDSLRMFYANGGGDCYIVSVGDYDDTIDQPAFETGIAALSKEDEPTMILFPDVVTMDSTKVANVQVAALTQCQDLQDRVGIFDLKENDSKGDTFRSNVGINNLNYGTAYTPWLKVNLPKTIRYTDIKDVIKRSGVPTSLKGLTTDATALDIIDKVDKSYHDVETITAKTKLLSPPNGNLRDKINELITTFNSSNTNTNLKNIFQYLYDIGSQINKFIDDSDASVLTFDGLKADVRASVLSKFAPTYIKVVGLEKETGEITGYTPTTVAALDLIFTDSNWAGVSGATATTVITADDEAGRTQSFNALLPLFEDLNKAYLELISGSAETYSKTFDDSLVLSFSGYKNILQGAGDSMTTMPPSGAVAGVYASTDRTRGVWKAPANVSLNNVISPTVTFTKSELDALNVNVDSGKSINAIRSFTGKGTLVFGARTLAGNDNEWRYISVRRFFNMVEESAKKATFQFVFEPNDANTWVKIRAMLENYLTVLWRQGALAGAKPEQAFFVKVGLGQTMTAQDILEGRLIVEIGMAAVRPAEFIILRFMHKMQES